MSSCAGAASCVTPILEQAPPPQYPLTDGAIASPARGGPPRLATGPSSEVSPRNPALRSTIADCIPVSGERASEGMCRQARNLNSWCSRKVTSFANNNTAPLGDRAGRAYTGPGAEGTECVRPAIDDGLWRE